MAGSGSTSDSDGTMPEIVKTGDVLGGDPRIEGHRIGVLAIYQRHVEGDETPEEIASGYGISIGEVHAALAYAFSNPDEMRELEARNERLSSEVTGNRVIPDDAD